MPFVLSFLIVQSKGAGGMGGGMGGGMVCSFDYLISLHSIFAMILVAQIYFA